MLIYNFSTFFYKKILLNKYNSNITIKYNMFSASLNKNNEGE